MAITKFQPEVWSSSILVNLRNALVYASLLNRDYEGNISSAGDTVHIVDFGAPSVRNYTKNADISWDLLTDAERTLVVDQGDYFAFTVDDIDRRQSLGGFVEQATSDAANALAEAMEIYIEAALVAGGTSLGSQAVAAAAELYDEVFIPARTALNRAKAPRSGRWAVINPEMGAYLLKDARFLSAADAADGGMALREGAIGRIAGFEVMESNNVSDGTTVNDSVRAIFGHSSGATMAQQIVETEALRLQDQFGDGVRGLNLYGVKVTRATMLQVADVTLS
jgi:hypothetical protein